MATLIKSKQIQGIVTASVVTGEFLVSGSLVVTGSNSILGSVTASAISSSFIGDGSGITGLTYSQISGTPNFVGGGDVTVTENAGTVTISLTDDTGTDTQTLSISGDQLSISGGNTITIPSGSGVSDYSLLTNIPQGIVSGSIQILGGSGILSGSKTDISSLNVFTSSIQTQVDGISAVTSSFLTDSGSVSYTDITNKPTLISSSNQITITESQISDLSHYSDSDVKTKLDTEGVISGSIVEQLPEGVISGSSQITITQSQISDLAHTDVANLNTFTSSIQSEVDSLTSVTSSYLTTVPDGTISGSSQVIESLPSGVISGSSQVSITESQISDLDKYTDSDVQSYIDSLGVVSGSVIAELPNGVISGSEQLPSGVISGSTQVVNSLPAGIISGSEQLPSGLISGSTQITITESQISDLTHTQIPEGTISGSNQVIDSLPDGVVSGSSQITITESQISDLDKYTDSDVKTKLDVEGVVSGSVIRTIPQGTISGSEQLPSGLISGSSQITITESQISDLSHTDISSLNTFTSSIQTEVDAISAATSSYLTSSGSVDFSDITSLPSGLVSGSTQITDGSGIVSSSTQVIEHLPQGTVSGSTQITDGSGILSSSAQIASDISSSYTQLSQSLDSRVDVLENFSGSTYTIASESIDSRLDALEGSVGFYYDLSNTVWNNRYIKSGSGMASNTSNFQTGNVPFKFKLNTDRKLQYGLDDVVYLSNFDRDTTITAIVSSSYETGSREVGLSVVSVNQSTGSVRINDSYWVISRHSAGFVDSSSYVEASASFDQRIGVIVSSGSGADWNVNLTNIPQGIISSSQQQYTASIENGFALTSSLDSVSSSLATTIQNVFQSSSNFDDKSLVSGSSQIDLRNVTNYVADEHIDHTTININAGDGLDGGGDISSTRELRLNVTSSHFTSGVGDVLTSEGVVKQSTLDTDIVGTDFSQSVDNRIRSVAAGAVPDGTVSGSTQVDIEQTQNFTAFSSSIATSIDGVSGGTTDISALNTFTSSADTRITNLESFSSSLDADFATDTEVSNLSSSLSQSIYEAAQSGSGVSSWNELSDIPSGIISGSEQIASDISGSFTSLSESLDTRITTEKDRIDNILSGANADYDQFVEIVDLVNSTDTENDTAFANHYTSSRQRLSSLESFTGSLDATFATDSELTSLSSSLSASIYNAAQSGSSSDINTGSFATTGSNTFIGNQIISGSIIPESDENSNGIHDLGSLSNPFGELYITTGSVRFVRNGELVSQVSGERDAIRVGNILITTSSLQIVSGSGNSLTTISTIASADVNEQGEVSNAQQVLLPDDIISSSAQITALGFTSESFSTGGTGIVSGSVLRSLDGTGVLSGSVDFENFSQSVDTRIDGISAGNAPAGTISSSAQITYDGNRIISNDKLGDLFTDSVNPGTSGSVIDFLNAVFYPNTGPSISTGNQTIIEYVASGTTITTITGTDPEGQAITFGTSSLYTDDLVRVASNGVMTLNALAESSSFNTDLVGGVHGHKVEVTATDSFGTITEKDIYVIVTPNSTPVFRETSTSGNVITSVTANLNESSTDDTLVKRVYFTDANGDDITIHSSSIDNNHFDVTKYSTYVDIRQNTGSLDYEQQTSYTFSISASDEHYELGQDSDSIVGLPITINVTDNLTPTINNQTLSSINENSSDGATVGSISAADNEGNTITFVNFELHQLQLDDSIVSSGSYSGTSQLTDPHENPFQMSTSGVVTRKSGVYLNSDLINEYIYRAQVTDPYNGTSDVALITINITDDTPATLSDNWSAGPYIKESELSGTTAKTTDYGSTSADYGSNQSGTWSSSNPAISINSNGTLSLGVDLSGSVTQSGDTIDSTITFTNTFGTTTTDSLTLDVVGNEAPTATFTNQTSVFDSNQATSGTNLVSVSISDTESDSPYQLSIGGTDASKLNAVPQNVASSSWELQASEDLIGGTYTYDVTITDSYSETTTYSSRTITIAQGDTGTLGGDTTSYIIESAESGDVLRDATGYNQGNASQLSVSYTNYGSPVVQSYTSSNEAFNIDTSGNITLGLDISGSSTGSGDTISSDITFVDQYGNIGSGSLTVNVFANGAPTATFTDNSSFFNTNQATGSVSLVDITGISDTESDTPYVVTLTGTDASSFNVVSQNVNGTVWELQPSSDLLAGEYDYNIVVTDDYSKSTTYSRSLIVSQSDTGTLGGDTTSYIIESAQDGDVFRDASGYNAGNASQVSVSYSPNYGSQVVQSFTSSNSSVEIDGSGNLTFNGDLAGTGSGETLSSTITFADQYGNIGSGSVTINVFDNNHPSASFTDNDSFFNSNQATGSTSLVDVSITDTESGTPYGLSISGTNGSSFNPVPQNSVSSSWEIQPSGNLSAGSYSYDVTITDNFGKQSVYNKSLTILAADTGTLVSTDTYIIESAETGDLVRRNTNGRTGTQSSVAVTYSPSYGSPVATNFASSDSRIAIDSSGRLSVGNDVSGSGSTNGSIIATTITWNDQYGNNGSEAISIDVTKNFAPTVNSTQTFSTNTNQATGSENIVRLNLVDTESDTISAGGLTWSGYNTTYFTPSNSTGQMNLLVNSTSVPAGSYPYTASIEDVHGFDTTVHSGSVTISQADIGTLGGNTAIYSIESAESGDVYRTATGYNNGSSAQVSVSYSPNYGSSVVQSYTSSNAAIAVDNSGNLTLGLDLSGSVTQSGDTINSTITFADQYGNIGSGSVTATLFGNQSPAASFVSSSNYDTDGANSGSTAGTLTVTDVENNSPFSISLGGTHGTSFDVSGSSSPFIIQPTSDLSAGTYTIDITVTDSYSETVTLSSETIIVDTALVTGLAYVYSTGQRSGTLLYDIGASAGSGTPPTLTSYSGNGFLEKIEDGDLGSTSFTYSWGGTKTATLLASGSGTNLDTILQGFGDISKTDSNTFVIIAPKDTDMTGVPTSMRNGYSGTATGEYVLEVATDGDDFGAGLGTVEDSIVYDFNIGSAVGGTTNYHLIVANNTIAPASSIALAVVPSSGSTP